MNRLLLAGAAIGGMVGMSAAADLGYRGPRGVPAAPNWSGVYVGGNLGYGWADEVVAGSGAMDGVVGGVQIGVNWQAAGSPLVLGIEADLNASGQGRSDLVGTVTIEQAIDALATVRGRLGLADGGWMVYATGGWAYLNYNITGTQAGASVEANSSHSAWVAGAGVEWMLMPQWSAKVEYLYLDSGDVNTTLFGVPVTGRMRDGIARAGLNYRF